MGKPKTDSLGKPNPSHLSAVIGENHRIKYWCCLKVSGGYAVLAKFTGVTATASPKLPLNYWHFLCSFILDLWPQQFSTPLKLKQLNWSLSPTEQSELIRLHPQQRSVGYRGLTVICLQLNGAQRSLMSCVCKHDQGEFGGFSWNSRQRLNSWKTPPLLPTVPCSVCICFDLHAFSSGVG